MVTMVYQLNLLTLLCVAGTAGAITANDCPPGVKRDSYLNVYGDKCYRFEINERRTFQDAQDYCQEDGGNLAVVTSEGVNNFIKDKLTNSYNEYHYPVWIGLRRQGPSNKLEWVDGSPLTYDNFDPYSYSSRLSDCAAMTPETGIWRTVKCKSGSFGVVTETKKRFICDYPTLPTTSSQPWTTVLATSNLECPVIDSGVESNVQVFGQSCYYFVMEKKTFWEAETFCESYGGTLALVKSQDINDFIVKSIRHNMDSTIVSKYLWIGLHFDSTHNAFYWLDDTPLDFSNFQSSTTKYKCVALNKNTGKWTSGTCGHTSKMDIITHFLCEIGRNTISTPYVTTTTNATKTAPTTTTTPASSRAAPAITTTTISTSTSTSTAIPTSTTASANTTTQIATTKSSTITTPKTATTSKTTKTQTATTPRLTTTQTPATITRPTSTIPQATTNWTSVSNSTATPKITLTPTVKTTKKACPSIVCEDLNCGLDGYQVELETGCLVCQCDS